MNAPVRVAMWSGPRNISTAMMRAWENREDCVVSDEPLYAHYLAHTGFDHPGREDVIAHGETDWRKVVAALIGPAPEGRPVWYQKHMTHHLLAHIDHGWIARLRNVLLIRDPREVVASYEELSASGEPPPIIDSGDFLRAPEAHLRAICVWLGIEFTPRMLHWPRGPRTSDGIWAAHWYAHVWESTGFEAPAPREIELSGAAAEVAEECRPHYERLYALRVTLSS
jgi:hypothetical protein